MLRSACRFVVPVVLLLALAGCNDDPAGRANTAGLLTEEDMPFDPNDASGDIERPPILTQLGTSCVGIEQGVLYDSGWDVEARQYSDGFDWTVITAVFTPPAESAGADTGLDLVRARSEECVEEDAGSADVEDVVIDGADVAYVISDGSGGFDSARAWTTLEDDRLAQVSIMKLPADASATKVLQDLVDDL